ncbi:MAG: hypothetical protein COA88_00685 [Kordia sp.]|nr:MAG: hypothetical protein COA88_00685 [Kordia sp.]
MKKILLSIVGILCLSAIGYVTFNKQEIPTEENNAIVTVKNSHREFAKNSPFSEVSKLSKKERKAQGLPPNKYLEREWELTMNPQLGRPTPENLYDIKKLLNESHAQARVSGDASDNNWVERGPNNVGGRTRAVMFDPNDVTNETVFAGGVSGGLWKNINISNGSSVWTQVVISENLNISCIVADPNNSMIFYLGTGESYTRGDGNGNGIWKSTDGGASWAKVFGGISGATTFQAASVITVNTPAGIAADYPCYPSTAFGSEITSVMTADFILADDGTAPNDDGCTAFVNSGAMAGKIALIRRGSCTFVSKVLAAQDAGAIGAIVMNNVAGTPVAMGGTDALITIPSVMISMSDGDTLVAQLGGGVNGALNPATGDYTGNLVPGAQHINDLVIRDNGGASEVYAAVGANYYAGAYIGGDSYGLYKSVNAGGAWTKLTLPLTANGKEYTPNDIAIAADNKVWIGTTNTTTTSEGGGKVLASTNAAGTTFEDKYTITNGNRVQIVASATNAGTLYVLAAVQTLNAGGTAYEAPYLGMVKTINSFTSTTNMALPSDSDGGIAADDFTRGQSFYDLVIAVDPTDDQNLYVGGIDLFKSTSAGASWSQFSHWYGGFSQQEVHADQHAIVFAPGASNKMIFGNDGGVYYSSNSGTTTSSRNSGYNTSQFYSIGVAPTSSGGDNFAGGLQDNGTQAFNNASVGMNSSVETQGGDGAATDYDQDTGNYYISNYVYNDNINQRNLNGSSIRNVNSESGSKGDFINQQDLDSNLNILYTNYTDGTTYQIRRYKIPNFGSVNKTILTDALLQSGGAPTAFKVSPFTTGSTKLYIGTYFGDLLRVDGADGNSQTWTSIGTDNFIGSISDVEFGATEADIFVTMHNYGVESVWYTSNADEADPANIVWQAKEGNLPDMPVKCILQNPLNTEEVVVGTELGVWYTNDFSSASPTWRSAFYGMSNVKVTDLDMRDDYAVYASTYGRGVFSGVFTATPLSINDEAIADNSVVIYPTISNGNVFVKSTVDYKDTKVMVYDLNGKLTNETSLQLYSNGETKLDLTSLSSGMYFVNLSSGKLNKTIKIIKK